MFEVEALSSQKAEAGICCPVGSGGLRLANHNATWALLVGFQTRTNAHTQPEQGAVTGRAHTTIPLVSPGSTTRVSLPGQGSSPKLNCTPSAAPSFAPPPLLASTTTTSPRQCCASILLDVTLPTSSPAWTRITLDAVSLPAFLHHVGARCSSDPALAGEGA
jgi:hypothetical protein